jgi:O-methyltransferase involved in polyketide biosynthesis
MADKHQARLGGVQETLFIPLAARARAARRNRPVLHDPKAVELAGLIDYETRRHDRGSGGVVVVLRTVIFDAWVRAFLAEHPDGTVVEIGTGLNTRFERLDNGRAHWIDLDLPDTIELRRKFFTDTGRRRMITASVLDDAWLRNVEESPGPYFFVAEGVLVYLPEDDVSQVLARIAGRFAGAFVALDIYTRLAVAAQHRRAADLPAQLTWACDHPRSLERLGLRVAESTTITRPPRALRAQLPPRYRYLMPLADPLFRRILHVTLFQASS